ncbi:D-serine ammonia-lyase [Dyella monticola]|uniref:Probable D-serine dehydratase n=1 Tax=Dyella monticola TaxID=1927958 RepID=A0A370WSC4_9GAMM|nr:D-serine ammonia-lyase [Dyella monticola]RDS79003.1 D-serine ammonia-lyase [Dyella monticola]
MTHTPAQEALWATLRLKRPVMWINPYLGERPLGWAPTQAERSAAQARFARCEPLLAALFPELAACGGKVESSLAPAPALQHAMDRQGATGQAWFIKRDDSLPVAGSIKARGGFHEVLALAEALAETQGLCAKGNPLLLASSEARSLFSHHTIAVGSTGNLGLSIGTMAAALGFQAVVHMSVDAKEWKKQRLRARGVRVVEHAGDYAQAVAAGRAQALIEPRCHFVDDENSKMLFLGYAACADHLAMQLAQAGRPVGASRPLCVYIPSGVGGAPGGIIHGLKALFGEHVHCFIAEPVASPCMLVQIASHSSRPLSVYDIGLDNRTEADGLAVALASQLASPLMQAQLSGVFTVTDDQLFDQLLAVKQATGIDLEPSAAAAVDGPVRLIESSEGMQYLHRHHLEPGKATHVIWATGGALVPVQEHQRFQQRALTQAASRNTHA